MSLSDRLFSGRNVFHRDILRSRTAPSLGPFLFFLAALPFFFRTLTLLPEIRSPRPSLCGIGAFSFSSAPHGLHIFLTNQHLPAEDTRGPSFATRSTKSFPPPGPLTGSLPANFAGLRGSPSFNAHTLYFSRAPTGPSFLLPKRSYASFFFFFCGFVGPSSSKDLPVSSSPPFPPKEGLFFCDFITIKSPVCSNGIALLFLSAISLSCFVCPSIAGHQDIRPGGQIPLFLPFYVPQTGFGRLFFTQQETTLFFPFWADFAPSHNHGFPPRH